MEALPGTRSPNPLTLLPATLLLPLLTASCAVAGPRPAPFHLSCRLGDGEPVLLRIDPRLQQLEWLDPRSGEVQQTLTTSQPPPELGGGIIDDSTVTVNDREIRWEKRMYRPQFVREEHRIDRRSLAYRSEEAIQLDMGPEMAREFRSGVCRPVDGVTAGSATPRSRP